MSFATPRVSKKLATIRHGLYGNMDMEAPGTVDEMEAAHELLVSLDSLGRKMVSVDDKLDKVYKRAKDCHEGILRVMNRIAEDKETNAQIFRARVAGLKSFVGDMSKVLTFVDEKTGVLFVCVCVWVAHECLSCAMGYKCGCLVWYFLWHGW